MTAFWRMSFVVLAILCMLPAPSVRAQEPGTSPAATPAEGGGDDEVQRARVRLAEQIDKSVQVEGWYVDLASTLVAANPLGIDVVVPDAALKAQLGLVDGQGVVVTTVPEGSQGEQAGVKVHDVLLAIDGQGVGDAASLKKLLDVAEGKELNLMLRRGGMTVELKTRLERQETARLALNDLTLELGGLKELTLNADRYRIGVTLSEADDTLRAHLGLAAGEGLVVTEVFDDTAASEAGIRVHDVLIVLAGKRLTTVDAVNAQIQEIKDQSVELRLVRGGKELAMKIAPRKTQDAALVEKPVRVWQTESCKSCHASAHEQQDPHALLGWKLNAGKSVWTDGHHAKLYSYWAGRAARQPAEAADKPEPQRQIETLAAQLAELQKTLSALKSAIEQPSTKPDERRE